MRVFRIASLALACGLAAYALPPAQAGWDDPGSRHERFCSDEKFGDKFADMQKQRAERLAERLRLTDAQKAAFKDVQAVRAKSMADNRAAMCAANPANLTFEKRLEFRQARLQARLDALKAENSETARLLQQPGRAPERPVRRDQPASGASRSARRHGRRHDGPGNDGRNDARRHGSSRVARRLRQRRLIFSSGVGASPPYPARSKGNRADPPSARFFFAAAQRAG